LSGLDEIRVSVETDADDPLAIANGRAVLHELERRLAGLVERGEEHSIDLRSLPMGPLDLVYLKKALGEGEVQIEMEAMGPSRVRETAIHGIWWVTHYNSQEQVVAEFIEVTSCPDIVRAHPADMRDSLEVLREKLVQGSER
jgi:hydrogenase-1 operon protein HyaF